MAISKDQEKQIKSVLRDTLKKKVSKYKRESSYMPFLDALIQDSEKVAAYSFIHSISTSLGMSIYEMVSVILAKPKSQVAKRNFAVEGTLSLSQKGTIGKIVNELREGARKVNKELEIKEVLRADFTNGKDQKDNKIADFFMKRDGIEYYFEIKTVKPNIDVFTKSKTKLLEWVARKKKPIKSILAFPYNPYFPEPYNRFTEQGVVEHKKEFLIAEEYWDFIGGDGTYKELLRIFDEVGKEFKEIIENKIKEVVRTKE